MSGEVCSGRSVASRELGEELAERNWMQAGEEASAEERAAGSREEPGAKLWQVSRTIETRGRKC